MQLKLRWFIVFMIQLTKVHVGLPDWANLATDPLLDVDLAPCSQIVHGLSTQYIKGV